MKRAAGNVIPAATQSVSFALRSLTEIFLELASLQNAVPSKISQAPRASKFNIGNLGDSPRRSFSEAREFQGCAATVKPENYIKLTSRAGNTSSFLGTRRTFFMAGSIYTRKGDKGKTSLFDGKRVWKFDRKVEAYGTIDELNSAIGVAIAQIRNPKSEIRKELEEIQNDLLEIGSSLAVSSALPVDQIKDRPQEFEKLIDKLTKQLPPLNQFILPGGGRGGASLHLARTIVRRAERKVVHLSQKEKIDRTIIIYLNRLSDLLFTFARFVNFEEKRKEKIWRKK